MGLIYHYTRFETFMSYILPNRNIRTNFLKYMNDPRESLRWTFGSTNLSYEKILEGYYSNKTHIDCQFKYGEMIKDRCQILCFSGAIQRGDNEMMWAHYGGMHSGVCLEFDEDVLLQNLLTKCPEVSFNMENMETILKYLVKDMECYFNE